MKNKIYIALISIMLMLLQITLVDCIKICNVKPNLMLVFMIILSFYAKKSDLFFGGILCGVLQDIVASKSVGLYVLINLLICMILENNKKDDFVTGVFRAFVYSLLYSGLVFLFCFFPVTIREFLFMCRGLFLYSAIYNTVCFIIVFTLVKKKRKIRIL